MYSQADHEAERVSGDVDVRAVCPDVPPIQVRGQSRQIGLTFADAACAGRDHNMIADGLEVAMSKCFKSLEKLSCAVHTRSGFQRRLACGNFSGEGERYSGGDEFLFTSPSESPFTLPRNPHFHNAAPRGSGF